MRARLVTDGNRRARIGDLDECRDGSRVADQGAVRQRRPAVVESEPTLRAVRLGKGAEIHTLAGRGRDPRRGRSSEESGEEQGGVVTARELRRQRLESAAERLGELEQAVDETRLALQAQLAENSALVQRVAELQALADSKQALRAERRTLLGSIVQAANTLEGME